MGERQCAWLENVCVHGCHLVDIYATCKYLCLCYIYIYICVGEKRVDFSNRGRVVLGLLDSARALVVKDYYKE